MMCTFARQDDEDRENEGDLIIAAEKVTAKDIAFMVRYTYVKPAVLIANLHGILIYTHISPHLPPIPIVMTYRSGVICVSTTEARLKSLGLPQMVRFAFRSHARDKIIE